MARTAPAPLTRLVRLVLCFSLIAQPLLFDPAGARAGSDAGKVTPPTSRVAARQEAEAADLPDLNGARNRPHHEPHAIPPVPSTRRRCPPHNRRCNDDIDGKPRPAPTPRQTSSGQDNAPSLASVAAQSLLAVLSSGMNGGRPAFDIPLFDFFSDEGGYSVSDSRPPLYYPAAAPLAQAQPNASIFVAQSVPTVMQIGQQYNVAVTMRNTGTNTWTSAAGYNLGSQNPQDNLTWGMTRVALPTTVAPGAEVTFAFTVTAPSTPGTYNFQWRVVQDGVAWFGDFSSNVSVSVASAAMVGRWKFDDGAGVAASDSSGNGNTGTLRNGAAWVAGTVGTGALDFDGVNDVVSVNTSATIDSAVNNFTVSFWVNPRATHQIDAESTSGTGGTSGQKYAWGPRNEPGSDAGAGISVGTNGVSVYEHAANYMPATLVYQGTITGWTHVTIVYQNKQPKLYVNGTLVRTGLTSPRAGVKVRPLDIGGMVYGYFNGQMDDVRLYNGVLTAGEITALANTPGRLVANWKLDEGSGTTASDSTGNGSTGTLQNGPTWVAGKVGSGALSFDGVNDGIAVSSAVPLTSVANDFAITFWANPRSTHEIDPEGTTGVAGVGGQRYVFGPTNYGGTADVGAGVSVGTNGVSVYEHGAGYMPATLVYQGNISGWTHVAVVYENRQPKLYLNGTLVRTGYTSPASTVRVVPWNLGGNSYGYFDGQLDDIKVFKGALNASDVQALFGGQGTGLTGEYYDNADFTGYSMTRTDATVNFDWGTSAPTGSMGNDQFTVRWAGTVVPKYSETYTFYTTTDDGVRLWIDGQLVIDKWVDQGPTEWSGQITLEAGRAYAIRMEFYENFGGAQAKLSWSSASQAKEIIPQTQLNGCWKDAEQFARDFYQGALARQPYAAELTEWTENLSQAQGDAQLVAAAQTLGANVFNSAEYAARNRSDIEYVTDLYWAYVQRAPDASGLNFWSGSIIACGSDQQCRAARRTDTRISFDQSGEFQEKVRVLCSTSAAAPANGGVGYDFSTARLDPNNRTGGGGTDPYSRNFNFSIPVLSLPGRAGLNLGLTLSYNSLVWTKDSTAVTYDADGGFPGPGFRLGFPLIEPKFVNPQLQQAGQPTKYSYLLVTPSGGRVELRQTTPGVFESADSSYLQLTESGGVPGMLRSTDGTQLSFMLVNGSYRCYQVKDRNGNYISVAYNADGSIDKVIDTLGRAISFRYDSYQNLLSIEQPWRRDTEANPNPTQDELHVWASFGYANLTLQPSFSNLAVIGDQPGMTIPVLSQVSLDDNSYYKFYYNQWGQVWKIAHYAPDSVNAQGQPTDSHALSFTRFDLPGSDLAATTTQTDCPRFTQEKTWVENGVMNQSAEVTTSYSLWAQNMASCEVTMPDLTTKQVSYYGTPADGWKKGLTTSEEIRSSGQLVKTTTTSWEHDGAAGASYPTNPRVTQTTVSDTQGNASTTRVTYTVAADFQGESGYTGILNLSLPKKVEECDAGCANVLRTTVTDYKVANLTEYVSRRILGLRRYQYLYEGTASLRAQTGYVYDEPNDAQDTFLAATATTASQHDGASYGLGFRWRGDANRMRHYSVDQQTGAVGTPIESRVAYNVTGTIAYAKDAAGHKTSFSYEDSFFQNVNRTNADPQYQLKTYAYQTTVTDPDNFTATTVYNYDIGAVRQTQTPLPNVTTNQPGPVSKVYYDKAGRVLKTLSVDTGAYTRAVYADSMTLVETYALIDTGVESYAANVLDGAGRVRAKAAKLPNSSGGYSGQLFDYDGMGRLARQSNPTATNTSVSWPATDEDAANGWLYTQTAYDWKGRPVTITNPPDANGGAVTTKEFLYNGCGCAGGMAVTTRDEVGRRVRVTHDVLGRVWKTQVLTQQPDKPQPFTDGPNESVYTTTTNTYDALDHVKEVRVRGEASGVEQVTTKSYDGYGRVASEQGPEQTAPTTYLYYDDNTVQQITDARGATTAFIYNGRRLGRTVTFGANGGAQPTTNLEFQYDAAGNRLWMTDAAGRVDYQYDSLSRLTSETRYFSLLSRSYMLGYSYNLAGQLSGVTDPFGASFSYQRDAAGQLTAVTGSPSFGGVTNYIWNIRYRAWGAVKSASYGNNSVSTTQYNGRLQPTQYRLTDATSGASLMREDYGYHADEHLSLVTDLDDASGNNPPSSLRFLSRTYSYDLAGRVTDSRGTHGAALPLIQTYGYDEFDNLTSRSGSYYDYNGSLTQTDASHFTNNRRDGWTYNADGRFASSPAASNSYARHAYYDAMGRQVKTVEDHPATLSSLTDTATFDGDGRAVYATSNDSIGTGIFSSSYTLRSTALGGEVLTTLSSTGDKVTTYVPAMGLLFARQVKNTGPGGDFVSWTQRDAAGVSETNKGIYDPLGNYIPFKQPTDPRPPAGSYNSGSMASVSGNMSDAYNYGLG